MQDLPFMKAEEYLDEFFDDDERLFGKRFDKIDTNISYNPYEESHILPFKKPLSINDINKVDIFGGSSDFDDNFEEFEDENGKDFDRDGEGSFNSAIGEINNISSYTIPMFRGVEDKEDFTYNWSIFGQQDYYSISTIEGKALAFLDTLKLKFGKNIMSDFEQHFIRIIGVTEEAGNIIVKVYLKVSFFDYVINTKTTEVTRGTDQRKLTNNYILTFVKAKGKTAKKCPNCGAPIKGNTSSKCPYCDSTIVTDAKDFVMSKKTNVNL